MYAVPPRLPEVCRGDCGVALLPEIDPEDKQDGSGSGGEAVPALPEGAGMKVDRFDNVWDAIEDSPTEAENMKVRSALLTALRDHIAGAGLTQKEAAKQLGVTQPRISDLMRGRVDLFAVDRLLKMLAMAGLRVEVKVGKAA